MSKNYLLSKMSLALIILVFMTTNIIYANSNIQAEIIGRNIVDTNMINENGIHIEVDLKGAEFKTELTEQDKINIAKGLKVDLDDGHIFDDDRGNLERLEAIKSARGEYLISVGTDQNGNSIDSIDRFLSYEEGIGEEISKNGEIFINENNNLEIKCSSTYFKNLKNNIIYTQGGVPLAWGDIPIYVNIPKEIIKDGVEDLYTSNFYAIIEMKAKVDILKYDDEEARKTKDENRTHIVESVTEEDIRKGGKLLKVTINSRNGPTKWTIDRKKDPSFIENMFRTNRDYGANQDDINWHMLENELGSNMEYGNDSLSNWNGYWISQIEDNRQETNLEDLKEMYYVIEFPVISEFDIDEDMNIYISLLSGMIGGSGRSGKQGTPYWGQDGRLSFTILAGDDSDKMDSKKDNAGNDEGFGAGSGKDFGNEVGLDSGSGKEQSEKSNIKEIEVSNDTESKQEEEKKNIKEIDISSDKENKQQAKKVDDKQSSQGSSGLSDVEKTQPKQIYEVSEDIIEETTIKIDYDYFEYIIVIFFIIMSGATYRYYRFSRFIKRGD